MSFTEKRLCNPTQLTTSGQTLYTVPSSKTAIIKQIVVTNVTGSPATFSLYIGSAATPNALFNATSVAGNDTIIVNLSQVLSQNEILTALASSNSTLNITISGVENDGPLNPLSTYIADEAITTAKLADSSVTTAKIATGAVTNTDISNNAVTQSKLASNLSGITITTSSTRSTDIPSPFEGQMIYETDTDRVLVYNASSWVDPSTGRAGRPGLVFIKEQTIGSSVSTVTVSDVFSADFDNYKILISGGSSSANARIGLQMGNTNSGYKSSLIYNSWSTTIQIVSTSSASNFQYAFNAASGGIYGEVYLSSPNLSKWTSLKSYWSNNVDTGFHTGLLENTTSYTSFTLIPFTGTLTGGTIRVYGYNQ